jgi:hypothetical protein
MDFDAQKHEVCFSSKAPFLSDMLLIRLSSAVYAVLIHWSGAFRLLEYSSPSSCSGVLIENLFKLQPSWNFERRTLDVRTSGYGDCEDIA